MPSIACGVYRASAAAARLPSPRARLGGGAFAVVLLAAGLVAAEAFAAGFAGGFLADAFAGVAFLVVGFFFMARKTVPRGTNVGQ